MSFRVEKDSIGEVRILDSHLWGAQTERSIKNFPIGCERMPSEVIRAIAIIKKSAARVNSSQGDLSGDLLAPIQSACDKIIDNELDDEFPLKIWQTGSGTQTNMNVNEVVANLAIKQLGGAIGSKIPVHPNDHINMGQSSNDTFPTAMHISAAESLCIKLLPSLQKIKSALYQKSIEFKDIVKIGRTHMQDATPISFGQEFSSYIEQLQKNIDRLQDTLKRLYELPQGGTAVGTGINTKKDFDKKIVAEISEITDLPFIVANNKFEALSSHDTLVELSGNLNVLATSLMKISNDIILLSSGPRCGIGEIIIPSNEPGSSIMPGKVNPTQCEAMTMVCAQVMGNHTTVTISGSSGRLQLNVFNPVIIYCVLQSITLLSDSMNSLTDRCITGIRPNVKKIDEYLSSSLMLVTALNKHIGYDNAAKIAKLAHDEDITLKEAALKLQLMTSEKFDEIIQPQKMLSPH